MKESSATVSFFYADLGVLPLEIDQTVWLSADTEQITASKLIGGDRNDTFPWRQLPDPLEQTIDPMTAEGVYDNKPTLKTCTQHGPVSSSCAEVLPHTQFETKPFRQGMHPLMMRRLGWPNFQGLAKYRMPELYSNFSHYGTS